jgi:hypothetical protein
MFFSGFFWGCYPVFRIRIHWFRIRIQGFDDKKLKKIVKKCCFSVKKIARYLSLGLHKGPPSYRRSLQPSKENIHHFKTWNFLPFSVFVGHFSSPGSGSTDLIESGSNSDPDLKHGCYHNLKMLIGRGRLGQKVFEMIVESNVKVFS